ncbi:hypothetical protein AWF84_24030 [Escherichia coli]|nr:hypothetical protein AWF84_24030 [Escherichia coli]
MLLWLLFLSAVPPVQLLTGWCVTAKALPVIRYFLLQFLDNRSSMKRSEKLKKYVEKELSGIRVSGRAEEEQLAYTLRNIQDEMFTYRASCPPVPNGIQLIMKPKNERIYVDYFETNLKELHLQK